MNPESAYLNAFTVIAIMSVAIVITALRCTALPEYHPHPSKWLKAKGKGIAEDLLDPDRLLWSIVQVENTPNHVIGGAGERSCYQITPAVWAQWSSQPHLIASSNQLTHRIETKKVAKAHIYHLRSQLTQLEAPETPYLIALAWTAGLSAVLNDTASPRKRDYASRVEAIYYCNAPER